MKKIIRFCREGVASENFLSRIALAFLLAASSGFASNSYAQNLTNTVTATPPVGVVGAAVSATDVDCKLQFNKAIQTAPVSTGAATFNIVYRVTVAAVGCTNAGSYALTDTPLFGTPGITINSASTVNTGGAPAGGALTPAAGPYTLAAANTAIAAGATHQYDVTINYTVGAGITLAAETCAAPGVGNGQINTGAAAGGLRNRATATATGGTARNIDACQNIASADLQATKSQRVGTTGAFQTTPLAVNVGQTVQYQLVFTNAGPDAANGGTYSDTVPSNLTGVTVVSTVNGLGATCNSTITGNVLAGTVATWPSGGTCTVLLQGTATTAGTITNTATTISPTGLTDPTPGNNSSSVVTNITNTPTVAKSLLPASIAPGGTSVLTLTLANNNASAATLSAALTDTLPAGVTVATPNGLGGTCTGGVTAVAGSGTVTYNNGGTIPANGSCTILVNVTSSTPGTVTNTIPAGALQTSNGNNAAATSAPLTVTNTISGSVFNDVNGATNSLVDGTGSNAGSASLTAYLVDGTGNVVGSSPVAANGTYTIANVANGTYSVVLSNTAGVVNGSAAPSASLPAGWNNTGEGLTSAGEPAAQVNGSIANVVVANASVVNANFGIEQPPLGQSNTNATQANPGGTSAVPVAASSFTTGATDPSGGTVTAYLIPSFPTGADSITINGTSYTAATFPVGGVTVAAANIGTLTVDPAGAGSGPATVVIPFRPIDNAGVPSTATYTATVPFTTAIADLAIQKNGPASVTAGGAITYTLTVSNAGTSAVTNVSVNDAVPTQISGLSVSCNTSNGGAACGAASNYSFTGNNLNAVVASLPSGGSVVLTISGAVAATATGSFTNTATVVTPAGVTDPNPANNISSVTSGVGILFTQADLGIVKTGTSTVLAGGAISYSIKVTNAGPADANSATVFDAVPAQITGVTTTCVAAGGAQCPASIPAGNSVNVVIPTLPSAASIELIVKGTAPTTAQAITNVATVTPPAGITDPIASNNSSSTVTNVTSTPVLTADLAVVKTGPATVSSSGKLTYSIVVVNNGPAAADGAVLSDVLPAVLTNATATCSASVATNAVCGPVSVNAGTVSSTITTLPAGGQITFTVNATAPVSGSFSNIATITPPVGVNDPNTTNNASGAVITQIQTTGIAGVVWRDTNRNSVRDASEPLLSGVIVTVRNSAGAIVGTPQTTDVNGAYNIVGLIPGPGYSVSFDFGNLDRGLVVPQNIDPSLNGIAANQTTIKDITLTAGVVTLNQNARVVDPAGVVYDSVSRTPVAGAIVVLLGPDGQPVPATQLLTTTPNNQVTTAAGSYVFLLNGTAPTGTYTLRVTQPAGYNPPNAVNGGVAQPSAVSVPLAPGTLFVQTQVTAPAVGASTTYYFTLNNFGPASQDVVNNHIPLDRQVTGNLLINKVAAMNVVELADSLKYTIRINNTNSFAITGAVIRDTAAAGFRYIPGTAKVSGVAIADPSGAAPTLSFALPTIAANSTTELSYFMRVGVGAQQSDGINRAQLFGSNGLPISNLAATKVRVTGGVLGNDACIIGKVYVDCIGAIEEGNVLSSSASGDQVQRNVGGSNELGISGVRVVMETGAYAVTDNEGKYSICPVTPLTHVLRVDKRTLPKGSRMLPQSNRNAGDGTSLFVDVKNGELHRADFMEGSCSPEVIDQIKARRGQGNAAAPETERPDAGQFRNQNGQQPFLPTPQQILPNPRQSPSNPSTTEGK